MFFLAALPAIASLASSVLAAKSGSKSSGATDTIRGINTPGVDAYKSPKLEEYKQVGLYSPTEEQIFSQDPSAYETIESDPRLRGSQIDALSQLMSTAQAGGLDATARAGLEDALERQRSESRGGQEAIMANARARGAGGSDLEFVNRMIAQQAQATAGSRNALDVAALAQQRRDAALQQAAGLAGNIRGMDYSQAAEKAAAADAINRFNAANRQDVTGRNVGASNEAQRLNLGAKQAIASSNVDMRNQQKKQNAAAPVEQYKALLNQGTILANAQNAGAAQGSANGQNNAAAYGAGANSLANVLGSLYGGAKGAPQQSSTVPYNYDPNRYDV